jgi:hypothetical protein
MLFTLKNKILILFLYNLYCSYLMISCGFHDRCKVLSEFEQFVLFSILKLRDKLYCRAINRLLSHTIKRDVTTGALYTILGRLVKGLLTSKVSEITPEIRQQLKKILQ